MLFLRAVGLVVSGTLPPFVFAACFDPQLASVPALDGPMMEGPALDAPSIDAPPTALGTQQNPARSCAELRNTMPSGASWVLHPDGASPPFQVYCEQELSDGGWAMVFNSVRREDGMTTAFWQFGYADRLSERGMQEADQNYYNGALYLIGREYMDVFVDLEGKTMVAAEMTAGGFDPENMRFTTPMLVSDDTRIYFEQFHAGWSAQDFDGDTCENLNCAVFYSNVAQHYSTGWYYNLGSDAEEPKLDGGVGPHVENGLLGSLGLAPQPGGGDYSQVRRIARFTRW